ncbi:MAG: peptidase MA family metallohydrolase [Planctomycetaceae bacterium]
MRRLRREGWPRLPSFLFTAIGLLWLTSPATAQDVDDCARMLLRGEYTDCLTKCQAAIDAGAYGEGWRLLKADAEMATGQYEAARQTLETAVETYTWSAKLRIRLRDARRFTGQADKVPQLDTEIAKLVESTPWRYTDAENLVHLGQLALDMGGDAREVQESFFQRARRNNPVHRLPRLALGRLALDKRDFTLAAEIFEEAVKSFPDDPDFLFSLSEAIAGSDPDRATVLREQTAAVCPLYIPLLLQQTDSLIESEDYDEAESRLSRVLGINEHHPAALAYWAVISHLRNDPQMEQDLRKEALSTWESNPEVDHIIGRELAQKYRFKEGAAYQRLALTLDADYAPARKQLASDLLRLGQETEGWELVNQAYETDQYDVSLYNLITLQDELSGFTTLERDGLIVRMDAHEAAAYGYRVQELLRDARELLTEKYRVALREPVLVEIFPKPTDFAVRTFGMPGVAGYLGVCFGNVITANSPASQELTPQNWESVLWHEFTHVITLNLTHNRMPRWVSEGISVYEERQRDPAWGERMSPTYRQMILDGDLTPVGKLSGAFLNPKSAAHVQFAYYESSLVIEYIVANYGFDALLQVLADLRDGVTINDALERHVAPLPQLEQEFSDYASALARNFESSVDWSAPVLDGGEGTAAERLARFLEDNPVNYAALQMYVDLLRKNSAQQGKAELLLRKLLILHPSATGPEAPALKLAELLRKSDRSVDELEILSVFVERDSAAPTACLRLIELQTARKDWEGVLLNGCRLRAIDPLTPHPHRAIAAAAEELHRPELALPALQSLLAISPDDPAGLHYRMARLLQLQGDSTDARRHVLMSLEEAPRYRDAQKLLLDLVDAGATPPEKPSGPAF